jgi:hypothetical protein
LADAGQPASFEKLPAKTLARRHEDLGLLIRQMNIVISVPPIDRWFVEIYRQFFKRSLP